MELISILGTFLVGVLASFIGSMVGGGGLISIPFLIFLGIPAHVAIATHRAGAIGLQIGALVRFVNSREIAWRYVAPLSILSLIAAQIGAYLLLQTDEANLRNIIVTAMLIMLPVILIKWDIGLVSTETSSSRKSVGYTCFFLALVWQAYFGGAAATMIFYIMMLFFGMTINSANATVKLPGLLLSFSTLIIFAIHGIVNWAYGIPLFFGMLIGGYCGAHTAIKKGNSWVKILFAVIVVLSALKLVFG